MARDWREYLRQQEIKTVPIEDVKPYPNNPRDNSPAVPAVAASIERFGFRNPILVDADGVIIEGHTRRLAAIKLGMKEVPVVYATDLTPDEVKALRVIDNKTAELADWDEDVLAGEAELLKDAGFDLEDFGFDPKELEALLSHDPSDGQTDADDVPDVDDSEPVRSKRGEVYVLGAHRLMCGDSTNAEDVRRVCADGEADLWLTDPPYNVNYGDRGKQYERIEKGTGKVYANDCGKDSRTILNDNMDDASFRAFLVAAFRNAVAAMKPGATYYIFHSDSEGFNFRGACRDVGLTVRQCLIWKKDSLVLGRQDYQWIHEPVLAGFKDGAGHHWYNDRKQTTVLEFDRPKKAELHPCLAPETMVMTDKGYVPIRDIRKGWRVLSADGRFHRVEFVSRHPYSERIYEIRAAGSNLVDKATHNHPYLVARRKAKGKADVLWVEAEDVRIGDFLMTPQVAFGTEEPMDELDAWCYGLWLAQGSVARSGNSRKSKYPVFALNEEKPELRDRLVKWGKGAKVSTYRNGTNGHGITVMVFDARKGEKCVQLCGTHAASKCVSPEVFTWSEKLRRAFFEGYMAGDGCIIKTRGHRHSKSVSRALASQIKFMAESLGYKVAMYFREAPKEAGIGDRKFKTTRPYWSSDYKREKERLWHTRPFEYKGVMYWLRRVVSATAQEYDSEVVNLSVEGCHTFQTACGMTHNTMKPVALVEYLMGNSSKKGDVVLETFGGSGTTLMAAEQMGRVCKCVELDPHYCDVIRKRWAEYVHGAGCDWEALTTVASGGGAAEGGAS